MNKRELRGNALLLLTALIWGCAFVAQSVATDYIGAFTFQMLRSILGGLVLLPFILVKQCRRKPDQAVTEPADRRLLWIGGVCCGTLLCIASLLQQIGIAYTSVGNAGFITAMYILFVPLLGLLIGKKPRGRLWICIGIAVIALYLLSIKSGFAISKGDILVFLCAIAFAVHILVVDYFSPRVDGVKLACIQFFVSALLSLIPSLLLEKPTVTAITAAWLPIVYAGVFSSGIAYTLQIVGQKYTRPTVASLLMSLESVFAVLAAMVVLGQIPTLRESIGCVLMFVSIIMAQLPEKRQANV